MKLRKCLNCEQYTFKEICAVCGNPTSNPHTPRFSPEDKYGRYRRQLTKI